MNSASGPVAVAAAGMVVAILMGPIFAPVAGADSLTTAGARLPTGREGGSAVWTGTAAYLFGGYASAAIADVVRFDPQADQVATMNAQLPTARFDTAAVWTGGVAYVLGGWDGAARDDILRYDPVADQMVTTPGRLPMPLHSSRALWTGQYAYLFGGAVDVDTNPAAYQDTIVRYDPATDTTQVMGARMPAPRIYMGGAWDGRYAYLFGGQGSDGTKTDAVLRYDPVNDVVTTMAARLPRPLAIPQAIWGAGAAFMFGGFDSCCSDSDLILRYDATSDLVTTEPIRLPSGREGAPVVWTGSEAIVLGGVHLPGFSVLDDILRYEPTVHPPGPTARVAAVPPQECLDRHANVTLDGTASTASDGGPLGFSWTTPGVDLDNPTSPTPSGAFPLGATLVTLTVTDSQGARGNANTTVVVRDTLPPSLLVTRPLTSTLYVDDYPVLRSVDPRVQWGTMAVGPLTVEVVAPDQCGVALVEFTSSSGAQATDTTAPFQFVSDLPLGLPAHVTVHAETMDSGGFRAMGDVSFDQLGTHV